MANGAHYFLYGKLNPAEKGVLQESGFGVTFPNYIVDVQKVRPTPTPTPNPNPNPHPHPRPNEGRGDGRVHGGDPVPVPRARRRAHLRGEG